MPRYVRPLSLRGAQALKKPGLHAAGDGLYLQVRPTGTKDWVYRYRLGRRSRHMGLGPFAAVSLAEARERARKAKLLVLGGIDPIDQRAATRGQPAVKPLTFRQAAERYAAAHEAGWKNGSKAWLASLENHAAILADQPVAAIDVAMIMAVVEPIWTAKPVTANNVRNRIEMILDWSKARGLRQGENPARWRGHLENLLPHRDRIATVKHREAMPFAETPAFMAELRQNPDASARVLEFQVLTAARSREVVNARWSEIDLAARLWVIPPERMKAKLEHRVPLSDAAIALLEGQLVVRERGDFVFPGRRDGQPIGVDASMKPLQKAGLPYTAHGFRSSFSDWAGETTAFPRELVESSLAHMIGNAVERSYRRGDFLAKRARLMQAWADFLERPAMQATAEVVTIRR